MTGIYIIFVVAATSWITKQAGMGLIGRPGTFVFAGVVILATIFLIGICYAKGERPRWRWGDTENPPKS